MSAKKATHQLTKQHNRNLVLKTIVDHETISRAAIARDTQLTRTTVSDVVSSLMSEGLVEEIGPGSSIGGKPSILLRLVADSRYLIGVNLAQNKFIGSVVNLRGEIRKTVEVPVEDGDGEQAIRLVYQILDQLVNRQWKPVVGIGVGTPGLINTREGVVINAVNLEWQDLPLASLLERRYRIPVRVLNDSQATAIGEFVYGNQRADNNLVVVNVGHGIGAGILINGRLFQGDGGGAGEIGHVLVETNGLPCRCGRKGCLETLASGRSILQAARRLSGLSGESNLDLIEKRFFEGDSSIKELVLDAAHALGTALGGLIGTLHIRKIILTGDVTRFGKAWLDAVREAMAGAALGRMTQETQLDIGKLDYRACILGSSAYLLLDDYSLLFNQKEN
ncbi:MAG TPA: ROK family protein [Anaerolineales bacterium]|nr:ROK family protein [Anaerolineales bacterium]